MFDVGLHSTWGRSSPGPREGGGLTARGQAGREPAWPRAVNAEFAADDDGDVSDSRFLVGPQFADQAGAVKVAVSAAGGDHHRVGCVHAYRFDDDVVRYAGPRLMTVQPISSRKS